MPINSNNKPLRTQNLNIPKTTKWRTATGTPMMPATPNSGGLSQHLNTARMQTNTRIYRDMRICTFMYTHAHKRKHMHRWLKKAAGHLGLADKTFFVWLDYFSVPQHADNFYFKMLAIRLNPPTCKHTHTHGLIVLRSMTDHFDFSTQIDSVLRERGWHDNVQKS